MSDELDGYIFLVYEFSCEEFSAHQWVIGASGIQRSYESSKSSRQTRYHISYTIYADATAVEREHLMEMASSNGNES